MRTEERALAMKKYFTAFPAKVPKASLLLKTGFGLIIFGIFIMNFFKNTGIAGYILICIGLFLIVFWFRPLVIQRKVFSERAQLDDMYKWLISDLHTSVKERAISVLRLNNNQLRPENFIIVPYPVFWAEPGIPEEIVMRRETEESNFLYTIWKVQVIALTQNYISYFGCYYNWLEDTILNESTNEFFYDDISSVKNDIEQVSKKFIGDEQDKLISNFVFKLTNVSSDHLSVITKIPELNYSQNLEVNLDKAVQSIRLILRRRRFNDEDISGGNPTDISDKEQDAEN
jgi:hypothetical protein